MTGKELAYIEQAHAELHLSGNGLFTKKCQKWIESRMEVPRAFLTHSGTSALEMAAVLARIQPGDEVIMPSYTFVSTANAFVLQGGIPVFVDIRPDTLNLDESKVEAAITDRTKAIVPVHYAGVGCEMDGIMAIAKKHGLLVIEDAAHGILASFKGKPLGTFGGLSALSFHETKNISSGEGGALLIQESAFQEQAEIVWEKGTDRSRFARGETDHYTWIDKGSSYLPNELTAAFLFAQMEEADKITRQRLTIWNQYHESFSKALASSDQIQLPHIPSECRHNGHMYYVLLPDLNKRNKFISLLKESGIEAVFHYMPLHSSPGGKKYARSHGDLKVTSDISRRLVRLPLWAGLEEHLERVIGEVLTAFKKL